MKILRNNMDIETDTKKFNELAKTIIELAEKISKEQKESHNYIIVDKSSHFNPLDFEQSK